MPKEGYSGISIGTPLYDKIKELANAESRPVTQQLKVIVMEWLHAREQKAREQS